MHTYTLYICLAAFLIISVNLSGGAQMKIDQLIISEVYLNDLNPAESWIEIHNPSDRTLILERFRYSHLRTINAFPEEIQERGGIELLPGEYLVLCADKSVFSSSFGTDIRTTEIDAISHFDAGGFMVIGTRGGEESRGEIVRYGTPQHSAPIAEIAGTQSIGFSRDGRSYSREIVRTPTSESISEFSPSTPNPGKPNN
jgi:hypothetical protein